jgi:hypothetical protein
MYKIIWDPEMLDGNKIDAQASSRGSDRGIQKR